MEGSHYYNVKVFGITRPGIETSTSRTRSVHSTTTPLKRSYQSRLFSLSYSCCFDLNSFGCNLYSSCYYKAGNAEFTYSGNGIQLDLEGNSFTLSRHKHNLHTSLKIYNLTCANDLLVREYLSNKDEKIMANVEIVNCDQFLILFFVYLLL